MEFIRASSYARARRLSAAAVSGLQRIIVSVALVALTQLKLASTDSAAVRAVFKSAEVGPTEVAQRTVSGQKRTISSQPIFLDRAPDRQQILHQLPLVQKIADRLSRLSGGRRGGSKEEVLGDDGKFQNSGLLSDRPTAAAN